MGRFGRFGLMFLAVVAFGMLTAVTHSQQDPTPSDDPVSPDQPVLADDLKDPAFDRYVDLVGLAEALAAGDAEHLTDLYLQLAEGERVLRRPHRAISAAKVFGWAVKAALGAKDENTIARLEQSAIDRKDRDLLDRIALGRQVGRATRALPPLLLTIDAGQDLSGLLAYQRMLAEIEQARRTRDREALEGLTEALGAGPEMDAKLTKNLTQLIAAALKEVSAPASPDDELADKLLSVSRGASGDSEDSRSIPPQMVTGKFLTSLPRRNQEIVDFCRRNFLRKVGTGQCASLNQRAIEASLGRSYSRAKDRPEPGDYVWGRFVTILTIGSYKNNVSKIQPGDLLQYRDVVIQRPKITYADGSWRSFGSARYTHHSAVAMGLLYHGNKSSQPVVHVYEQNTSSNGQVVSHGANHVYAMKSGYINVYRFEGK